MSVNKYELLDETGYTATVFRLPGTRRVCKSFFASCAKTHFPAEVEAYERFTARGHPATILNYYGLDEDDPAGIILELAEKGNLHKYRWDCVRPGDTPSRDLLYRWARQAAEALAFAHSCGVLHSDIHCSNFLLDENLDLKVADFAEASIDGGGIVVVLSPHALAARPGWKGEREAEDHDGVRDFRPRLRAALHGHRA